MYLRSYIKATLAIALTLSVSSCEHEIKPPTGAEDQTATLSRVQSTIFTQRCATSGCHVQGGSAPMRLDTKSQSFVNLVGINSVQKVSLMRVKPGEPDNSYLIHKVDGQPNISNQRMPPGGTALSAADRDFIRAWILAGAQNN